MRFQYNHEKFTTETMLKYFTRSESVDASLAKNTAQPPQQVQQIQQGAQINLQDLFTSMKAQISPQQNQQNNQAQQYQQQQQYQGQQDYNNQQYNQNQNRSYDQERRVSFANNPCSYCNIQWHNASNCHKRQASERNAGMVVPASKELRTQHWSNNNKRF
jgi:hypothetical protein